MKFHDFLRLSFSDTILAQFLHVSLPTLHKLQQDLPLSDTAIREIGRSLAKPDAEILNQLDELQKNKRSPVISLDSNRLSLRVPPLDPLASLDSSHYAISYLLTARHELIVVPTKNTQQLQKRINHALYADRWQQLDPCPLDTLDSLIIQKLMRSIFNQQPPLHALVDHTYYHHQALPLLMPALLMLDQAAPGSMISFALDRQMLPFGVSPRLIQNLNKKLVDFSTRRQLATVTLNLVDAQNSLALQAARLGALAVHKLPTSSWRSAHVLVQPLQVIQQRPLIADWLAFEKRGH